MMKMEPPQRLLSSPRKFFQSQRSLNTFAIFFLIFGCGLAFGITLSFCFENNPFNLKLVEQLFAISPLGSQAPPNLPVEKSQHFSISETSNLSGKPSNYSYDEPPNLSMNESPHPSIDEPPNLFVDNQKNNSVDEPPNLMVDKHKTNEPQFQPNNNQHDPPFDEPPNIPANKPSNPTVDNRPNPSFDGPIKESSAIGIQETKDSLSNSIVVEKNVKKEGIQQNIKHETFPMEATENVLPKKPNPQLQPQLEPQPLLHQPLQQPQLEPQPNANLEPKPLPQPQPLQQSELEPQPKTLPLQEPQLQPQPKPQPFQQLQLESQPKPQFLQQPQLKPQPKPHLESKLLPQPQPLQQSELQPQPKTLPLHEPQPKPQPFQQIQLDPQPKSEFLQQPQLQPQPKPQLQPQPLQPQPLQQPQPLPQQLTLQKPQLQPPRDTNKLKDDELFLRASMTPKIPEDSSNRVRKVAFMFLVRGVLPLAPLWDTFFKGHEGLYSIYVHTQPSFKGEVAHESIFHGRRIQSKKVEWGKISMVEAERRLLANALLDTSNERFVLLSEACIPLHNFTTIHSYLMGSSQTFVESYDLSGPVGRGRYNSRMQPTVMLQQWRKGSQWKEVDRFLAQEIIADRKYFSLFRRYCKPACYSDEHYIPTYISIKFWKMNSNRTLTWVDWSKGGPHPSRYEWGDVTPEFLQGMRYGTECLYNGKPSNMCYMFARKFSPNALSRLLELAPQVLNFNY